MSRDSAGVYTLPNPPVEPGTTIEAEEENQTRSDMEIELTNSLDRYGRGALLGPLRVFDGTALIPGLAFASDQNSGIYREGVDKWHLVAGGVSQLQVSATGIRIFKALELVTAAAGDALSWTNGGATPKTGYLWSSAASVGFFDQPNAGGNGVVLQTAVNRIDVNVLGNVIASIDANSVNVASGKRLRVISGVTTPLPTAGTGIELAYDSGAGGGGAVISWDRSAGAPKPLQLHGLPIQLMITGSQIVRVDATQILLNNDTTINSFTSGIALQYNGVTHARVNANGLNWGTYSNGAYPNVGYIPMRTVDGVLHQIACIA